MANRDETAKSSRILLRTMYTYGVCSAHKSISQWTRATASQRSPGISICEAEVVRRALHRALGTGDVEREDRAVIASTSGLLADYPDWPEWLSAVRGQSAEERLRSLGL